MSSTQRKYNEQYHRERELVEPILANDPAFADVRLGQRSSGGIWLEGTVPTERDRSRLREAIVRAVGESRADEILIAVSDPDRRKRSINPSHNP
jgi:hypothetical protein